MANESPSEGEAAPRIVRLGNRKGVDLLRRQERPLHPRLDRVAETRVKALFRRSAPQPRTAKRSATVLPPFTKEVWVRAFHQRSVGAGWFLGHGGIFVNCDAIMPAIRHLLATGLTVWTAKSLT